MPKVRCKDGSGGYLEGTTHGFNMSSLSEINVHFMDEADSVDMHDLEVQLQDGQWKDMMKAFHDKDIMCNNHNTDVDFPHSEKEREQGYNWF